MSTTFTLIVEFELDGKETVELCNAITEMARKCGEVKVADIKVSGDLVIKN